MFFDLGNLRFEPTSDGPQKPVFHCTALRFFFQNTANLLGIFAGNGTKEIYIKRQISIKMKNQKYCIIRIIEKNMSIHKLTK